MTEGTEAEAEDGQNLAQVKIEFANTEPVDIFVDPGELGRMIETLDQLGISHQDVFKRDGTQGLPVVTRTIDTQDQLEFLTTAVNKLIEGSETTNNHLENVDSRLRLVAKGQSRAFWYIVVGGTTGAMATFGVSVYCIGRGLERWVPKILRSARRQPVDPQSRTVQSMDTELDSLSRASGS